MTTPMTTDVQEQDVTDHETDPSTGAEGGTGAVDTAIEAVLLTADRPVAPDKLGAALETLGVHPDDDALEPEIERAVERLNAVYERTGRAFRIERVGGGWRVMTLPEHAPAVAAFKRARAPSRLSKPALETLSIVAYRQPVTRATLESIRGVACGEVLKTLMDLKLVMIKGRAEELGRPMLYGTTRHFLDTFGLASLKDLPEPAELAPGGARIADGADGGPSA